MPHGFYNNKKKQKKKKSMTTTTTTANNRPSIQLLSGGSNNSHPDRSSSSTNNNGFDLYDGMILEMKIRRYQFLTDLFVMVLMDIQKVSTNPSFLLAQDTLYSRVNDIKLLVDDIYSNVRSARQHPTTVVDNATTTIERQFDHWMEDLQTAIVSTKYALHLYQAICDGDHPVHVFFVTVLSYCCMKLNGMMDTHSIPIDTNTSSTKQKKKRTDEIPSNDTSSTVKGTTTLHRSATTASDVVSPRIDPVSIQVLASFSECDMGNDATIDIEIQQQNGMPDMEKVPNCIPSIFTHKTTKKKKKTAKKKNARGGNHSDIDSTASATGCSSSSNDATIDDDNTVVESFRSRTTTTTTTTTHTSSGVYYCSCCGCHIESTTFSPFAKGISTNSTDEAPITVEQIPSCSPSPPPSPPQITTITVPPPTTTIVSDHESVATPPSFKALLMQLRNPVTPTSLESDDDMFESMNDMYIQALSVQPQQQQQQQQSVAAMMEDLQTAIMYHRHALKLRNRGNSELGVDETPSKAVTDHESIAVSKATDINLPSFVEQYQMALGKFFTSFMLFIESASPSECHANVTIDAVDYQTVVVPQHQNENETVDDKIGNGTSPPAQMTTTTVLSIVADHKSVVCSSPIESPVATRDLSPSDQETTNSSRDERTSTTNDIEFVDNPIRNFPSESPQVSSTNAPSTLSDHVSVVCSKTVRTAKRATADSRDATSFIKKTAVFSRFRDEKKTSNVTIRKCQLPSPKRCTTTAPTKVSDRQSVAITKALWKAYKPATERFKVAFVQLVVTATPTLHESECYANFSTDFMTDAAYKLYMQVLSAQQQQRPIPVMNISDEMMEDLRIAIEHRTHSEECYHKQCYSDEKHLHFLKALIYCDRRLKWIIKNTIPVE